VLLVELHTSLHSPPAADAMYSQNPNELVDIQAFVQPWQHSLLSSLEEIGVKSW